ncbi:MAG TPA: hypothetical protein VIJ29_04100 [Candidatus Paceibacterota bacterium]
MSASTVTNHSVYSTAFLVLGYVKHSSVPDTTSGAASSILRYGTLRAAVQGSIVMGTVAPADAASAIEALSSRCFQPSF